MKICLMSRNLQVYASIYMSATYQQSPHEKAVRDELNGVGTQLNCLNFCLLCY